MAKSPKRRSRAAILLPRALLTTPLTKVLFCKMNDNKYCTLLRISVLDEGGDRLAGFAGSWPVWGRLRSIVPCHVATAQQWRSQRSFQTNFYWFSGVPELLRNTL